MRMITSGHELLSLQGLHVSDLAGGPIQLTDPQLCDLAGNSQGPEVCLFVAH